ncbi:MAG: carbohydrate-binding protein [Ruminococcaceae bacterium]|nr:carbohydrate-binding protein [Oscillospiraceae bacterium]
MVYMKKVIIALTLVLSMILTLIPLSAQNEADFVLEGDSCNISGEMLLSLEGCFIPGENRPEENKAYAFELPDDAENNKQMLHRIFKGDTFNFTVDFGEEGYTSLSFCSYGAAKNTVIELYIDNTLVGEGTAKGGNGWADYKPDVWFTHEINFDKSYTGIHDVKIVVIDSAPAFPSNSFGKFVFNKTAQSSSGTDVDFVLDKDEFNIKGSDLIQKAEITQDTGDCDKTGQMITSWCAVEVPEEAFGQMLFNVGAGDSIKFTVDFGEKGYSTMGFYNYGSASVSYFELYIDDQLIGEGEVVGGNGWIDAAIDSWNYDEIDFGAAFTGVHTVEIRVVESAPSWPFNVFGNFLFYYAPEATEAPTEAPATEVPTAAPTLAPTENPTQAPTEAPTEEKSCGSSSAIAQVMLILGVALIIKKKK